MKVILREDVANLGRSGEVVTVKDGYGRNYLLPRKRAVAANERNIRQLEDEKGVIAAWQEKLKTGAQQTAKGLEAVQLKILRKVGEQDKLYRSVTVLDIAEALAGKRDTSRSPDHPSARADPIRGHLRCRDPPPPRRGGEDQGRSRSRNLIGSHLPPPGRARIAQPVHDVRSSACRQGTNRRSHSAPDARLRGGRYCCPTAAVALPLVWSCFSASWSIWRSARFQMSAVSFSAVPARD
jgi:large subunit ribosomal protein L9